MSDNPNAKYFQSGLGSIAGFLDSTSNPDGVDIVRTGWSLDQLKQFLLNEGDLNFPPEDWVRLVNELITDHLNDFDNPHNVTLNQIVSDLVKEVLGSVTPGTAPAVAPLFAYDATAPLPLGDIFPMTYSSTNLYRMTEGGIFTNPASENQVIGVDTVTNKAGIPLFGNLTNIVTPNWYQQPNLLVNTQLTDIPHPSITYPFHFYQVTETNSTGDFGIDLPIQAVGSTGYTASFFILPSINNGSLVIGQPTDSDNVMTVKLSDGSYTLSSNQIVGETFVYPSGIVRISFGFITSPYPDNAVRILHQDDTDTGTLRKGTATRPLFSMIHPMVTTSTLNQPVLVNPTLSASASPLVAQLTPAGVPPVLNNFTLSLTLNLYPKPLHAKVYDTNVVTMGQFSVTRDQTRLYVNLAGIPIYSSVILTGTNVLTISYSPTKLICKDLANVRKEYAGAYPPVASSIATLGPCGGYLNNLALYGVSDTDHSVEFLTNG